MAIKEKIFFTCQQCGHRSLKWQGRCPDCNSWNSLVEELVRSQAKGKIKEVSVKELKPISKLDHAKQMRLSCGIGELDRILGGGLVVGSVVLVGGDPGIGKSTLMLQASHMLSKNTKSVLYISGEESATIIIA